MVEENIPHDIPQADRYFEEIDLRCNHNLMNKFKNVILNSNLNMPIRSTRKSSKTVTPVLEKSLQESIALDDHTKKETKKNDRKPSDHYATFKRIHNLNLWYGYVLGLAISKTWKYNNFTRWTKFMLIFGSAIALYSHLVVITQPTKLIEVFSLFGMIIPAFLKFNLFVKTNKEATSVIDFVEEIFKINDKGPKADVLKKHIDGCFTSIKIFIPIQTAALLVFVCYPVYGYVYNNELIQIMPMQFPFIDQTTPIGFIVANAMMMKMGVWAYVGSVGFDLFLARMIHNYLALVKLLQQDLIDYTEMCRVKYYSKQYRNAFFHNFLLKCQDKDRLIQFVNNTYADVIFKQFGIVYVCLTFTIYAIIRSDWYSGYGILTFFLAQLYILCILGTTIQSENKKFCAAIYDIPWYDYPLSTQKNIQTLLHSSQNALELWIGPFAPLNVESGLEITKSMYSTSTMIINTSE